MTSCISLSNCNTLTTQYNPYTSQLSSVENILRVNDSRENASEMLHNTVKAKAILNDTGLALYLVIPGTEKESIKCIKIVNDIEISYHCGIQSINKKYVFNLGNLLPYSLDTDTLMPIYEDGILTIEIAYAEGSVEEYKVY